MWLNRVRSMLFVPVLADRLLAKASTRRADALVLDLEDSIAPDRKDEARKALNGAVEMVGADSRVLVRINAEPEALIQDVASLPLSRIQGLLLPKVESAGAVLALAEAVRRHAGPSADPIDIVALIETPLALLRLESIATAHPWLAGLGFGAEDYATAMGVDPEPPGMLWAAQNVANAARAFDLACFGLPGSVADLDDMQRFASLARLAQSIGFTGSVCVHPRQVAEINQAFSPSEAALSWARQVVEAADTASAQGLGAVRLHGRMIDAPVIERARRLLARE